MPDASRLFAWATPHQESLLTDAIDEAGLNLVGIGSPSPDEARDLADRYAVDREDDLRQAVQREDVDVVWIAAPIQLTTDEFRPLCAGSQLVIVTEPQPAEMSELSTSPGAAPPIAFAPLFRRSPGYLRARAALEEFGAVRCVNVCFGSGPGQGSLSARLFDAVDLLASLGGTAEGVDAARSGPDPGGPGPSPESGAVLHGHLTANVRFTENVCASVAASDEAGSWFRRVTIVGEGGVLTVDDEDYTWSAADGSVIEPGDADRGPALSPGRLVGRQIIRLVGQLDKATDPPPDTANLLALCAAARLSCRTQQGEAPRRLLEMLRRT